MLLYVVYRSLFVRQFSRQNCRMVNSMTGTALQTLSPTISTSFHWSRHMSWLALLDASNDHRCKTCSLSVCFGDL